MKRPLLALALLVPLGGFAACGDDDESTSSAASTPAAVSGEGKTIGFSTITLNDPFFVELNGAFEAAGKEQGADIKLLNPNGDPAAQANNVETLVTQGADAIVVDAIDPNGIVPPLRAAKEAGIPVLAVDETLSDVDFIDASIGNDNFGVGKQLGENLAEQTMDESGAVEVAAIHTLDAPIENQRLEGFLEGIKANPKIKYVGRADAKFNPDLASKGAENLITANPSLDWFYTAGTTYAVGALAGIKSQDRAGKIKIIGWDISKALVPAMKDGTYVEAVRQDPAAMGSAAVKAALQLAAGEQIERDVIVPVTYVTKDTLDETQIKN